MEDKELYKNKWRIATSIIGPGWFKVDDERRLQSTGE